MKRVLLISLFSIIGFGCSNSALREPQWQSVTLARQGGFSGLEERYQVSNDGTARKYMRFPGMSDSLRATTMLDTSLFAKIVIYTNTHLTQFDTMSLHEAGNMTTSITIQRSERSARISWPNIDPPPHRPLIDTLYDYLMQVQSELAKSR